MGYNLMSVVGLLSLLGMAWLISYHRKKVEIRPVVVGVSLQLLLAMVIMPTEKWLSFLGMSILAMVLVIYMLEGERRIENPILRPVVHAAAAAALGYLLYVMGGAVPLGWGLVLVVALLIGNGWLLKNPVLTRYAGAFLICCGMAYLIREGLDGRALFETFTEKVEAFLKLSNYGASFMFGYNWYEQSNDYFPGFAATFAFGVLPTIIFFGGFMSVLYYLGVVQRIVVAMGHFMSWAMGTSGSESLSCSANIFVGQTEAPLLVRPFIPEMTQSELLTIMVGGFATIAGGVLAGYISMGVDAGHLIAASVMSAPAALVMGKIICPETRESKTKGEIELPQMDAGDNLLEAASNGITDGFKLALNVGAMLIGFIALIAFLDVVLNWIDSIIDGSLIGGAHYTYSDALLSPATGEFNGIFPGSLQTLFGSTLKYLAMLMGVPAEDATQVGNLLGIKLSLNEFVAYGQLGTYITSGSLTPRGELIATYSLCGFANFASIGIQLGGIAALVPERRKDLAKLVLRAMFGGAFASWTTACVAGIFTF